MTMTQVLAVDISAGIAEFQGNEVNVGVAVIIHSETKAIVWQSQVAVPLMFEDWLERCVGQLSAIREDIERWWPEVAVYTNWWMIEPGDEHYPYGLSA